MKTRILIIALLVAGSSQAQDPHFSQYYANSIYLNPAFAGSEICPRATLSYRNQWPKINGGYNTFAVSYDQHVKGLAGGISLQAMKDIAGEGDLSTTVIQAGYSYPLRLDRKHTLRAGVQAGFGQRSVDWSKLTFEDMINPRYGFIYGTNELYGGAVNYLDISTGALFYSDRYYAGFAVHHLNTPSLSLISQKDPLPMKYTAHAGMHFSFLANTTNVQISPNILYRRQFEFTQLNVGCYAEVYGAVVGLWVRPGDAAVLLVGMTKGNMKMAYNYDLAINGMSGIGGGAHEISYTVNFKCKDRPKRYRVARCAKF